MAGVLHVEDSTYADRSEVTHEQCLLPILTDLGHKLVHHKDCRNTSEGQNHESKDEEPHQGNSGDVWHLELLPGQYGTDIHEAAEVQNYVDAAVDFIMSFFGFLEIGAVPIEEIPGDKAGEQVISTEEAAYADRKEL